MKRKLIWTVVVLTILFNVPVWMKIWGVAGVIILMMTEKKGD